MKVTHFRLDWISKDGRRIMNKMISARGSYLSYAGLKYQQKAM
jgi:hypothetical protein